MIGRFQRVLSREPFGHEERHFPQKISNTDRLTKAFHSYQVSYDARMRSFPVGNANGSSLISSQIIL